MSVSNVRLAFEPSVRGYLESKRDQSSRYERIEEVVTSLIDRAKAQGRGDQVRSRLRQYFSNFSVTKGAEMPETQDIKEFCMRYDGQPMALRAFNAEAVRNGESTFLLDNSIEEILGRAEGCDLSVAAAIESERPGFHVESMVKVRDLTPEDIKALDDEIDFILEIGGIKRTLN